MFLFNKIYLCVVVILFSPLSNHQINPLAKINTYVPTLKYYVVPASSESKLRV